MVMGQYVSFYFPKFESDTSKKHWGNHILLTRITKHSGLLAFNFPRTEHILMILELETSALDCPALTLDQKFVWNVGTLSSNCKRHCTLLVIVKDQSSHLVYLNICMKYQTCENLSSIGRQSCEITVQEKNTLVTRSCVLSDAWFRDLKL